MGGKIFAVTLDMMVKYEESFFGELFSGRWTDQQTEDGTIFINRSPLYFQYVVDFLRDGYLDVDLSETERRGLLREADFYQLRDLIKMFSREHTWTILETPNGTLSEDRLTLSKKSNLEWDCCARGSLGWKEGVQEWTVRLDSGGRGVMLGISLADIDPTDARKSVKSAYAVGCATGRAWDTQLNEYNCFNNVPSGGLPVGTLVSIRLDMDNRTLTFGLNGQWNSLPTFTTIKPGTYYPYFTLYSNGTFTVVR